MTRGPQGYLGFQDFVVHLTVAFEGDAVDDRIFDDGNDKDVAIAPDGDIGKQTGGVQALQGAIDTRRIEVVPRPDEQVGTHRLRFDPLRALDDDLAQDRLGPRPSRQEDGQDEDRRKNSNQ